MMWIVKLEPDIAALEVHQQVITAGELLAMAGLPIENRILTPSGVGEKPNIRYAGADKVDLRRGTTFRVHYQRMRRG